VRGRYQPQSQDMHHSLFPDSPLLPVNPNSGQ
jgi:hypothetical protein